MLSETGDPGRFTATDEASPKEAEPSWMGLLGGQVGRRNAGRRNDRL
jgi:hypothetical protein